MLFSAVCVAQETSNMTLPKTVLCIKPCFVPFCSQVKLPEINITIDTPITHPELPTFAACAKYLVEFAKALRPVVNDIVPNMKAQPMQVRCNIAIIAL